MKRRTLSVLLFLALLLGLASGCKPADQSDPGPVSQPGDASQSGPVEPGPQPDLSQPDTSVPEPVQPAADPDAKIMVLSGPTGVGAARLMADQEALDQPAYQFEVVSDNSEVTAALIRPTDSVDIACIATNVAANLYNKSNGAVRVLAVNTLGVLYILEKGDTIRSISDLAGKTVYATGQGANPEYILNYLLTSSQLDPEEDVDIQWMTAQEVTARMTADEGAVCMLPVPAATALLLKDSGVRQALDLSAEWDEISSSPLVMGCVVARTAFIQEHPEVVSQFLEAYVQSIDYMKDAANADDAAELVARFGITANAAAAKAAIPQCNLTCITGTDMRHAIQRYYEVLFQADPASIGGGNPDDAFYYIP